MSCQVVGKIFPNQKPESKGLHAFVGPSYNGIGFVLVKQGKIDLAIDYYFKALESYRELKDYDKQLELLVGIGLNYGKLEQWEETIGCLKQAVEISKYIENRKEETQIRMDLAEYFFKLGKRDLATVQINKAEEYLKITRGVWSASLIRRIETLKNF